MYAIKIEKATKEKLHVLDVDSWSKWECAPSVFQREYICDELAILLKHGSG